MGKMKIHVAKKAAKKLTPEVKPEPIAKAPKAAKATRKPRAGKSDDKTLQEHSYLLIPHGEDFEKIHAASGSEFMEMIANTQKG